MKNFLLENNVKQNEDLSRHNTIKIGGVSKYYFEPNSIKQLLSAIKYCQKSGIKYYILGNGSKVIFKDSGFDGMIICTKRLTNYAINKNIVKADCGLNLFVLNKLLVQNSLSGLEFSYGIPGTIGGAVCMNAGAYGEEIGDKVRKVKIFDGKNTRIIKSADLDFSYRNSLIKQKNYIVLSVWLKLEYGNSREIKSRCQENFNKRKLSQPLECYNCGSIFQKTNGIIAGKTIDNLGLKGVKINGAQISTLHANFIVNKGNAKCSDVEQLIKLAKTRVFNETGVWLCEEVIIIGDD